MTQTSFGQAKSNFSSWIPDFITVPGWLSQPSSDHVLFVIFSILALACLIWVFWDKICAVFGKEKIFLEDVLKQVYSSKKFSDDKLVRDSSMNFDVKNYLLTIVCGKIPLYGELVEGFASSLITETDLFVVNRVNCLSTQRFNDNPKYYNVYVYKSDLKRLLCKKN